MPEVLGGGDTAGELRDLPIGVAEAREDRLDDRGVVEMDVRRQLARGGSGAVLAARLAALSLPRGPRTGAAGGLGAKLQSLGAKLVDGAERMLTIVGFD